MEENYIVSARKYRPSTFSTVVGQKALTATLRNAIATKRLAHAYLFCGSRGVGKTSCARIFAKTINCEHPTPEGDPCNECPSCRSFNENRSLNIIELDAASNNGVDDIRSLVEQVQIPPTDGNYRVFIIDEVHMLTSAAFNAFLKTLEEPPSYVIFILATTEKHKIIPTILSRCQIYDFNRITISDIIDHLEMIAAQEGMTTERAALNIIARKADGAMRDALSIFDQVAASSRGNITYQSTIDNLNVLDSRYYGRLVEDFRTANVADALLTYKEVRDRGFDSHFFLTGLASYLRDLMVAREPQTAVLLDADGEVRQAMAAQGGQLPPEFFYAAMSLCNEADLAYRQASDKTFLVELLLIRLCQQNGPSPICSGGGEGRELRKIEVSAPASAPATQAAAPRMTPPAPQTQQPVNVAQAPAHRAAPAQVPPAPMPPQGMPRRTVAPPPAATDPSALRSGRHFSLKSALNEQPKATVEEVKQAAAQVNREPFTVERLHELWNSYMEANPKAHLLYNTMRASRPVPKGGGSSAETFVVTVENQAQVEQLNEEMPRLMPFLRSNLRNDYIAFELNISENALAPTAWSDRDLLAHFVESHPYAAQFISDFKLTLS